jgi:sugar lactone lactonase YvrE
MAVSLRHDLLFVAGGFTGQGYVYHIETGETVATYQFSDPSIALINDVAITKRGAYFTDTHQAQLYFVPIDAYGELGEFSILPLSGPAADTGDEFNLNGIQATEDGKTLIVAHTGNGELYTVNPWTGESALIAGVSVPNVDGIVLEGRRLWAVQNFSNQVSRVKLSADLTSGVIVKVITSELFQVPSTAALFGNILAVVNAKFDTGFPPTADQYEVVLVHA